MSPRRARVFRSARLALCAVALLAAAGRAAPAAHFVEARGARFYVQQWGTGPPIVFLHGGLHFFDNSFAAQRDEFARTHTVIGIDQRGHGHSPDDARPFSYPEMAEDTAAILRALGVGPVDLVGHSDGGDVALLLARTHPELVRRVVVSGANLRPAASPEEVRERQRWTAAQWADYLPRVESRLPATFRPEYEAVTPDGPDHWRVVLEKSCRLWLTPVVIDSAGLAAIEAPVLVIAGDRDFVSVEETTEIFRGLRRGRLFIVPGTGHGTFAGNPGLINPAIRQFLDAP